MNPIRSVVAAVLVCVTTTPAWSQTAPVRVTMGGRLHYQWNSTSVDGAPDGATAAPAAATFEQRRARIGVDVQVADWIRARLEPEFAMGRLAVRQAWMAFELDSALVVRAGQMKKPFGVIMLTSSTTLPVIERGVRIRGLDDALRSAGAGVLADVRGELLTGEHFALQDVQRYTGYDMGLTVEGSRGAVSWVAGVFNGGGPDLRDETSGVSAAARLAWRAPTASPFTVGASWSRRDMNWPAATSPEMRSGNAFALDAEYGGFRRGVWLLGEVTAGENLATGETFTGAHVVTSWFLPAAGRRVEGWEPVARVSWGDPDGAVDGDDGVLLTPGLNLYFAGRNRLMLNWDWYVPSGDVFATQHALRAQVNLNF